MERSKSRIGVVCYGNILRSQVLAVYLRVHMHKQDCLYDVYDAGVSSAPFEDFRNPQKLLADVEAELLCRGLTVQLHQTTWSRQVAEDLSKCKLILVADKQVRLALQKRLPFPQPPIYSFYELLGESDRDFIDTYEYDRQAQHPEAFASSFDELERIAAELVTVLPTLICE